MTKPPVAPTSADEPQVCAPVTGNQLEVLRAARDNRGIVAGIPDRLTSAVASLALADLLEFDAVGFRLTEAGVLFLARVEELRSP